ncbi:hypothetical protein, partial [Klebsiella quasipneumoniae]|nr:hypothetical protein [Enterobacter hormaechei]
GPQNDVTLKMPAFEWVHVQLHQQKGMISLSPPTICNSANAGLFLFVASLLAFIGLHSRMYCGYALYSPVYYLPVSHPAAGGTRQPAAA